MRVYCVILLCVCEHRASFPELETEPEPNQSAHAQAHTHRHRQAGRQAEPQKHTQRHPHTQCRDTALAVPLHFPIFLQHFNAHYAFLLPLPWVLLNATHKFPPTALLFRLVTGARTPTYRDKRTHIQTHSCLLCLLLLNNLYAINLVTDTGKQRA